MDYLSKIGIAGHSVDNLRRESQRLETEVQLQVSYVRAQSGRHGPEFLPHFTPDSSEDEAALLSNT